MRWIRVGLWAGMSLVYFVLTSSSYTGMKTHLPDFGYRIPADYNIQIGGVRFQDVINQFADRFDSNVVALNRAMYGSQRLAFWTNMVSLMLSLMDLALDCTEAVKTARAD